MCFNIMNITRRRGCMRKILFTLCVVLSGFLLFTNWMEPCNLQRFTNPTNNLLKSVEEIKSYGFSSAQMFNNITSIYSVIKDPSNAFCGYSSECEQFDMVYVVKSYIAHFEQRMAIRKTWGSDNTLRLKTLFVVGYSEHTQILIDTESKTYMDIIQFDMIDNYRNLVYKTIFSIFLVSRSQSANTLCILS